MCTVINNNINTIKCILLRRVTICIQIHMYISNFLKGLNDVIMLNHNRKKSLIFKFALTNYM